MTVRYWIADTNEYPLYYMSDGSISGLYHELITELEQETGFTLERITQKDGVEISPKDALNMLEDGDLDIVLGLPEGLDTTLPFAAAYDNALTAVILSGSPETTLVENCYWGIDSSILSLTENTILDGHVLDFNGENELFEALQHGDVYGILLKRSILDNITYTDQKSDFKEFEGIKLPYTDGVYYNPNNAVLKNSIENIAGSLKVSYAPLSAYKNTVSRELISHDTLAIYYNRLSDATSKVSSLGGAAYFGITAAVIFAAVSAVLWMKLKNTRSIDDAKLRTLTAYNEDQELFELDLKKKSLYAYRDFAIFGIEKGKLPNPIRLEKLTELLGYDFTGHFSNVSMYGTTLYKNRFIIHVGGKKLYIAESGKRTGHILMVTMTLVKQ